MTEARLLTQAQTTLDRLERRLSTVMSLAAKIHPRQTTAIAAAHGRIAYLERLVERARRRVERRSA